MPEFNGTSGDDTLVGTALDDRLTGGGGRDTLTGGAGQDMFIFGQGDSVAGAYDTITDFTTGSDALVFGVPTSLAIVRQGTGSVVFASYASGPQTVIPIDAAVSAGDLGLFNPFLTRLLVGATMVGLDGGADTLIGGQGRDSIYGLAGDDVIIGGYGADALAGGAGADIFRYVSRSDSAPVIQSINTPIGGAQTEAGYDNLFDFETGIDRIDVTQVGLSSVSIVRQGGSSFLFGNAGFQIVAAGRAINGNDLIGYNGSVYMVGSDQADTLIGSSRADGILGGDGADIITGGAGGDALGGGAGADVFRYTATTDSNANGYDNLFDFQTGIDKIDVTGVSFLNTVSIVREGGSSFVFMSTLQGATMQLVAAGRDINIGDFLGGSNSVYLQGSSAADLLIGASGGDTIIGGDGADIIIGGGSADTLYGGAGADVFRYTAASDSLSGGRGRDFIQDFVSGVDKVDLTLVRTGANDRMGIAYLNGNAHLFVDLGGNGVNDMEMIFTGATLLTSDILWAAGGAAQEDTGKGAGPSVLTVESGGDDQAASLFDTRSGTGLDRQPWLIDDATLSTGSHPDQNWWF